MIAPARPTRIARSSRMRRLLNRWQAIPSRDRVLLMHSVVIVAAVRVALSVLSPRRVMAATLRLQRRFAHADGHGGPALDRVVWAVRAASRRIPKATCLTQAIATQLLLMRSGRPSALRLGVARDERGMFAAHAWVEVDGCVVIGGGKLDQYTRLPDLHASA